MTRPIPRVDAAAYGPAELARRHGVPGSPVVLRGLFDRHRLIGSL